MVTKIIRILKGPSKFDLMLSLFNGEVVEFESEELRDTLKIVVTGVEVNTYENWFLTIAEKPHKIRAFPVSVKMLKSSKIDSFNYSTKTRYGIISISGEE